MCRSLSGGPGWSPLTDDGRREARGGPARPPLGSLFVLLTTPVPIVGLVHTRAAYTWVRTGNQTLCPWLRHQSCPRATPREGQARVRKAQYVGNGALVSVEARHHRSALTQWERDGGSAAGGT